MIIPRDPLISLSLLEAAAERIAAHTFSLSDLKVVTVTEATRDIAQTLLHMPTEDIAAPAKLANCSWREHPLDPQELAILKRAVEILRGLPTPPREISRISTAMDMAKGRTDQILVRLEDGSSLVMKRDACKLFEEAIAKDQGSMEIHCRENGIEPQIMFRMLIALRKREGEFTSVLDFLSEEQMGHLDPTMNGLLEFFTRREKNSLHLIEKFGEEQSIEIFLKMVAAAEYLLLEHSYRIGHLLTLGISHRYRDLPENFLVKLFRATERAAPSHLLDKLKRNLHIEILSRRYEDRACDLRIQKEEGIYPLFSKQRFLTMTDLEKEAQFLRAIRDLDNRTLNEMICCFRSAKIGCSLKASFYEECLELGHSGMRRALSIAALFNDSKAVDKILFSSNVREILKRGKYGLFEALQRGVDGHADLSLLEKILDRLGVTTWAVGRATSALDLSLGGQSTANIGTERDMNLTLANLLRIAVQGGHIPLIDKIARLLADQPITVAEELEPIILAAIKSGNVVVMDKALACRPLDQYQRMLLGKYLLKAIQIVAETGRLEVVEKVKTWLEDWGVPDWDYSFLSALENAAKYGKPEIAKQLILWIEILNSPQTFFQKLRRQGFSSLETEFLARAAARSGQVEAVQGAMTFIAELHSRRSGIAWGAASFLLPRWLPSQLVSIIKAAARSGVVPVMEQAITLLGGQILPLEDRVNIIIAAIQSGELAAMDKAATLIFGAEMESAGEALRGLMSPFSTQDEEIPLLQLRRILVAAAGSGEPDMVRRAKTWLAGQQVPVNESGWGEKERNDLMVMLNNAITSGHLGVFSEVLALAEDRPFPDTGSGAIPLQLVKDAGLMAIYSEMLKEAMDITHPIMDRGVRVVERGNPDMIDAVIALINKTGVNWDPVWNEFPVTELLEAAIKSHRIAILNQAVDLVGEIPEGKQALLQNAAMSGEVAIIEKIFDGDSDRLSSFFKYIVLSHSVEAMEKVREVLLSNGRDWQNFVNQQIADWGNRAGLELVREFAEPR